MQKLMTLALSDFKIIFRDPSLKSFFFLPLLLFGLMVWGVPPLVAAYPGLGAYLSLFLVVAVIENTQMFSFISSMVLIDEKETDVAKVYGVVPLSKSAYILSRFLIPFVFTVLLNVIMFEVQPLFDIGLATNLLLSVLAALVVPVYALAINSLVENRMQGMVYIKAFNMLVLMPIAAFFVPVDFRHVFGLLPTHWLFQGIDYATKGLSPILLASIGYLVFAVLLGLTARLFIRRHFR